MLKETANTTNITDKKTVSSPTESSITLIFSSPHTEKESEREQPIEIVLDTDFADPSVWKSTNSGKFEAVATETIRNGKVIHVQHALSDDLSNWELQPTDLFPSPPEWSTGQNIWAPVVFEDKHLGPLLGYGGETKWGDYGISIARYDESKKHFIDFTQNPIISGSFEGISTAHIDPFLYRDDEDRLQMVWGSAKLPILRQELKPDASGFANTSEDPHVLLKPRPENEYERVLEGAWLDRRGDRFDMYISVGDTFGNGVNRYGEYAIATAHFDRGLDRFLWRNEIDQTQSSVILEGNKRFKNPGNNSVIHTDQGSFLFYHVIDRENQYFDDFPGRTNFNRRPMARSRILYDEHNLPFVPNGRYPHHDGEVFL